MFGCKEYPDVYETYPGQCPDDLYDDGGLYSTGTYWYLSVFYFTFFIVIIAQVLLTLFIGVVSTSMDEARQVQVKEFAVDGKLRKLRDEMGLSDGQIKDFKIAGDQILLN